MLPKITTPNNAPFALVSHLKAEILCYAAMGTNISLQNVKLSHEHIGCVHVISKNIELEYDGNKIALFCSLKWISVMCALNNISLDTIKIILRVFKMCPSKMLTIICAVMAIPHHDIMSTLLRIIFNEKYFSDMYKVSTIVMNESNILCYSKYFEEYNPHNISNHLIYYFDNVHQIIGEGDVSARATCCSGRVPSSASHRVA